MVARLSSLMYLFMYIKRFRFLVFFITIIAGITFTACSTDDESNDEYQPPSYLFQTNTDKDLERRLMNTKWKLTKIDFYNDSDKIDETITKDWSCYFSPEEASGTYGNKLSRLGIFYNGSKSYEEVWSVFSDGFILYCQMMGKIVSLSDSNLIISNHKIVIPDLIDNPTPGGIWYWERVVEGDDDNEPDNGSEDLVKLSGHWSNVSCGEDEEELFAFDSRGAGSIVYEYTNYPEDDEYEVTAIGTYTISGVTLRASYSSVRVYLSNGGTTYKGFTNGVNCAKTYTIVSSTSTGLTLKDSNGVTLRFKKY